MQKWLNEKSVIYQIFIDRFAGFDPECDPSKPEWCGGNIKGIIDKLDYLKELGVNAIYVTPFFKSSAYHGYATEDFYDVDPHFGEKEDIKNLTAAAHDRNIRVIIDFVANHISKNHPIFQEACSNPKSQYVDWFHFEKWPNKYQSFLDFHDLPKLNLENKEARNYIIQAAKYWIDAYDVDGLRLDHVVGQSKDFWKEFSEEIKEERPDVVLIAEAGYFFIKMSHLSTLHYPNSLDTYINAFLNRGYAYKQLFDYYHEYFDAFLDFNFHYLMSKYAQDKLSLKKVKRRLKWYYKAIPTDETAYITFLDNHDKSRFMHVANNDFEKLKNAAELQESLPHPMLLYYGTEIGLSHKEPAIANTHRSADTPTRGLMQWGDLSAEQQDVLDYYKKLFRSTGS